MLKKIIAGIMTTGILTAASLVQASDITIASGGGYKRPLLEIIAHYEHKTGNAVAGVFGNMYQIITQVSMSGNVCLIIGDTTFFDGSDIDFSGFHPLGKGKLVLAYRKGTSLEAISDINNASITRIGMPDPAKAIYGKAATEYLNQSGLMPLIDGKLLKLSTVPQVSTYLKSKEIDAGFINLTDAIGIKDDIGGYIVADPSHYSLIIIQAGIIKGFENDPDVQSFISFLKTEEAGTILRKYGL